MIPLDQVVLDADAIARTRGSSRLSLLGIERGGTPIAARLAAESTAAELDPHTESLASVITPG